jgi:hypothetical protein
VYVRRLLARRWNCLPWEVDQAPEGEIELELAIMEIEGEAAAWHARQRG